MKWVKWVKESIVREWKVEDRKWLEMEQEEWGNGVNQKYLI
jgi:hypothetical protein